MGVSTLKTFVVLLSGLHTKLNSKRTFTTHSSLPDDHSSFLVPGGGGLAIQMTGWLLVVSHALTAAAAV